MGICDNFNIYTNNCNLVYIFRKRRNIYVITVKQRVDKKYRFYRKDFIRLNQKDFYINNYVNARLTSRYVVGNRNSVNLL